MRTLSRTAITGPISSNTPHPVIKEIALAHGINYSRRCGGNYVYHEEMVRRILKTNVSFVEEPYDIRDWLKIARFINPTLPAEHWPEFTPASRTIYTLRQAFERYWRFRDARHFDFSRVPIQYGEMSPSNINVYDACLLYRYCTARELKLGWQITVNDMIKLIRTDTQSNPSSIKREIISLLNSRSLPKRALVNALHSLRQGYYSSNLMHSTREISHYPLVNTLSPISSTNISTIHQSKIIEIDSLVPGFMKAAETSVLNKVPVSDFMKIEESDNDNYVKILVPELRQISINDNLEPYAPHRSLGESRYITNSGGSCDFHKVIGQRKSVVPIVKISPISLDFSSGDTRQQSVIEPRLIIERRSTSRGINYDPLAILLEGEQLATSGSSTVSNAVGASSSIVANSSIVASGSTTIRSEEGIRGKGGTRSKTDSYREKGAKRAEYKDEEVVIIDNGISRTMTVSQGVKTRKIGETISSPSVTDIQHLMDEINDIIDACRQSISANTSTYDTLASYLRRISGLVLEDSFDQHAILHNTLKNIKVINHSSAVIYVVCNYLIDISASENPLAEYNNIMNHSGTVGEYVALSPTLRRHMKPNRCFIDGPLLSSVFNPCLNIALYHPRTLISLANYYGLNENDPPSTIYSDLQESSLLNNFNPGIVDIDKRLHRQRETIFYQADIDEMHPSTAVSYGNVVTGYTVIDYEELYRTFDIEGYFRQVTTDDKKYDVYREEEINHLTIIAMRKYYSDETKRSAQIRRNLVQVISKIRSSNSQLSASEQVFIRYYRTNSAQIDRILALFFDLTMKMRGWEGKGPYPISRVQTCNMNEVYVRVTTTLANYDKYCAEDTTAQQIFESLPLYRYNLRRKIYIRSNKMTEGLTIGDRINIVRRGDDTINTKSCLRMSSNWFTATYCHAKLILGQMVSFDINGLKEIF